MLPIHHTGDKNLSTLQTEWAKQLNPIIALPLNNGVRLVSVRLLTGDNVIDHRLGRKLLGWQLSRIRAAATIYDKQDDNQSPDLTLVLNTSANVTVDLYVW